MTKKERSYPDTLIKVVDGRGKYFSVAKNEACDISMVCETVDGVPNVGFMFKTPLLDHMVHFTENCDYFMQKDVIAGLFIVGYAKISQRSHDSEWW